MPYIVLHRLVQIVWQCSTRIHNAKEHVIIQQSPKCNFRFHEHVSSRWKNVGHWLGFGVRPIGIVLLHIFSCYSCANFHAVKVFVTHVRRKHASFVLGHWSCGENWWITGLELFVDHKSTVEYESGRIKDLIKKISIFS